MRSNGSLYSLSWRDLIWLGLSIAVLLGMLLTGPVAAQHHSSRITAVAGQATLIRGGVHVPIKAGTPLHVEDRLVTANDSRVAIAFGPGDTAVIGADSAVVLRYFDVAAEGAREGLLELLHGILRVVLRPGPDTAVEVSTRTAIASVRSTEWVVEAKSDGTGVFTVSGSVDVMSRTSGTQVRIGPGEGTDVPGAGEPSPAKRWGEARVRSVLERTRQP